MTRRLTLTGLFLALPLLMLGCHSKQHTSEEPVIGALLPLSGDNASFGVTARNAYQIAEEDARQQHRTPLHIVYGDSRLDKITALSEYGRLVHQDHVVAFVEATGSGIALALSGMAARDQVPILSAVDTSPLLTTQGGPFFFRNVASDAYAGMLLTGWAVDDGLKSAVLVANQQNDWAVGFKGAVIGTYREKGGSLPDDSVVSVTDETVDFNSAIAQMQKKSPQAWFVGLMGRQAGLFVKQAAARGIKGPFMGVDNLAQGEFVAAAGAAQTSARLELPAEIKSAAANDFSAKYVQLFQRQPDSLAFKAYDAYFVILQALEAAKQSGQPVTGALLQQKLTSTNLHGLTGEIQFDKNHDLVSTEYQRLTYDGKGQKIPVH